MHPPDHRPGPAPLASAKDADLTITAEFRAALDHLRAGRNLFLTGKAGTGKSTLIRHHLATTARRTITVAPTGIAALNVGGYTVHRLFSFPPGVTEEHVHSADYRPRRFAAALAELDTLIIDEASMVRADLFDAIAGALGRFGPDPGAPLGGVQLVLVGDLYQLPPVVPEAEAAWIDERYGTPFFFSAHSFDPDAFPVVELTEVFRQRGDDRLARLLNAVRGGRLLEAARAELNTRTRPDFQPELCEFWLTLTTTNKVAAERNRQMLARITDSPQTFTARISGETDGFEHPTDEQLTLAVGAQVMMLVNDPADRWVNGTLGRITMIGADEDGPVLTVELRGGDTVQVHEHTWEITRPQVRGGSLVHEAIGVFVQFPLKLAWAITIHKSQGQTLDRVIVDLTGGTFAGGQLYVALSRCTSFEGLVLRRDVSARDLKADLRVRRYLERGAAGAGALGAAYVAAVSVGTASGRARPRPVEIAVVTDDGDEATTIVNPTRDLASAAADFQITARDVELAPLLTEAWPALRSVLAGRVPVGVQIDRLLADIDAELKRHGVVDPMPLGIELPAGLLTPGERAGLAAPTALARARTVRDAARRLRSEGALPVDTGTAFSPAVRGHGYLLARTTGGAGTTDPVGFTVGGRLGADDDPAQVLAGLLRGAWARVPRPDEQTAARIRGVEAYLGIPVLPEDLRLDVAVDPAAVLVPGARVCFSGSVHSPTRGPVDKDELHGIAAARGLVPVPTLTKSKTDVLIVAEAGSQSGKAKSAARWGKPVIAAEEFLLWAALT